jgi:hypothetical protein
MFMFQVVENCLLIVKLNCLCVSGDRHPHFRFHHHTSSSFPLSLSFDALFLLLPDLAYIQLLGSLLKQVLDGKRGVPAVVVSSYKLPKIKAIVE